MKHFIKKTLIIIFSLAILTGCNKKQTIIVIENDKLKISLIDSDESLWQYSVIKTGKSFSFHPPEFEIDGKLVSTKLSAVKLIGTPEKLINGTTEYIVEGSLSEIPDMTMRITFRVPETNPIIKFRYELLSKSSHKLTKTNGHDKINYLKVSFNGLPVVKEVRFSEFNEMVHSFCLSERIIEQGYFADSLSLMGPMVVASDGINSFLVAYEHGSQAPDKFLEYVLNPDRNVTLKAFKGNYYNGFQIDDGNAYQSIWFETGAIAGDTEMLAGSYRNFVLHFMSLNSESRKPYIFYNTWNFQERNRHWYKKPYLADMTLERMMKEIDAAHKMGIDVFVIDAGWFEKTGDWTPSLKRFPDGLKNISKKLKENGMKLGLWFNPTVAAASSNMIKNHRDCIRTFNGDEGKPFPVWETEESYGMCLVSKYRDAFADELIRLYKDLGVTYFKWDAIGQYECNDPRHFHGNSGNTPQERMESYGFEIGRSMSYVVDKLTKECPDAIVDFDITEGGRAVGLGFLSSGKYFLINNGPYFFNYDIPFDRENGQWNIFFYPGPARTWICRTPLTFDKWVPTSLFLTHYLPDDPYENQSIAVGSLILGQNGIWGDLPGISKEGVDFFNKSLGYYKQVRNDMTETSMIRDGAVGGSPEVYEKINPETGKGAVVVFSSHAGSYSYITKRNPDKKTWKTDGVDLSFDAEGHAVINTKFLKAEAQIVFFGVEK
jgi:alpha-galactosidase